MLDDVAVFDVCVITAVTKNRTVSDETSLCAGGVRNIRGTERYRERVFWPNRNDRRTEIRVFVWFVVVHRTFWPNGKRNDIDDVIIYLT